MCDTYMDVILGLPENAFPWNFMISLSFKLLQEKVITSLRCVCHLDEHSQSNEVDQVLENVWSNLRQLVAR